MKFHVSNIQMKSRIATRAALLEGLRDKVYKHSHEDSGDDQPQKAARATSATSKKACAI